MDTIKYISLSFSLSLPGINRKVTYDLEGNEIFVLDEQTGILSVTKTLDRETRAMYNLTVTAKDYGTPQLASTTNILVLVSGEDHEFGSSFDEC